MLKNTLTTYGSVAKFLHWIIALFLIGLVIAGYVMTHFVKSDLKYSIYDLHKATGLLVFGLVAFRLLWRLINPEPRLFPMPAWQKWLVKLTIVLLYALMFLMPISGFLTSMFGGYPVTFYHLFTLSPFAVNHSYSDFFATLHSVFAYTLVAVFILHVAGAWYHHLILKDETLRRMWIRAKQKN